MIQSGLWGKLVRHSIALVIESLCLAMASTRLTVHCALTRLRHWFVVVQSWAMFFGTLRYSACIPFCRPVMLRALALARHDLFMPKQV